MNSDFFVFSFFFFFLLYHFIFIRNMINRIFINRIAGFSFDSTTTTHKRIRLGRSTKLLSTIFRVVFVRIKRTVDRVCLIPSKMFQYVYRVNRYLFIYFFKFTRLHTSTVSRASTPLLFLSNGKFEKYFLSFFDIFKIIKRILQL